MKDTNHKHKAQRFNAFTLY